MPSNPELHVSYGGKGLGYYTTCTYVSTVAVIADIPPPPLLTWVYPPPGYVYGRGLPCQLQPQYRITKTRNGVSSAKQASECTSDSDISQFPGALSTSARWFVCSNQESQSGLAHRGAQPRLLVMLRWSGWKKVERSGSTAGALSTAWSGRGGVLGDWFTGNTYTCTALKNYQADTRCMYVYTMHTKSQGNRCWLLSAISFVP